MKMVKQRSDMLWQCLAIGFDHGGVSQIFDEKLWPCLNSTA